MIAVYDRPESMTEAQYQEISARVSALGDGVRGLKHHSCFGNEPHLAVFQIFDEQADYEAFTEHLTPLLEEAGVRLGSPDPVPVIAFSEPGA